MQKNIVSGLVFVVVIAAYVFFGEGDLASVLTGSASDALPSSTIEELVVQDIQIYDMDGRVAYEGDVDLRPELGRIEAGISDPHENDGATFGNREGLLPDQTRGYYREYVVRTPGINHAGPQRIVMGEAGEAYYTPDHYETFRRIQ